MTGEGKKRFTGEADCAVAVRDSRLELDLDELLTHGLGPRDDVSACLIDDPYFEAPDLGR